MCFGRLVFDLKFDTKGRGIGTAPGGRMKHNWLCDHAFSMAVHQIMPFRSSMACILKIVIARARFLTEMMCPAMTFRGLKEMPVTMHMIFVLAGTPTP
jgi:hypothetical protein